MNSRNEKRFNGLLSEEVRADLCDDCENDLFLCDSIVRELWYAVPGGIGYVL